MKNRAYEIVEYRTVTSDYEYGVTDNGAVVGYIDNAYYPQIIIGLDLRVGTLTQPQLNIKEIKRYSQLYTGCIELAERLYGGLK